MRAALLLEDLGVFELLAAAPAGRGPSIIAKLACVRDHCEPIPDTRCDQTSAERFPTDPDTTANGSRATQLRSRPTQLRAVQRWSSNGSRPTKLRGHPRDTLCASPVGACVSHDVGHTFAMFRTDLASPIPDTLRADPSEPILASRSNLCFALQWISSGEAIVIERTPTDTTARPSERPFVCNLLPLERGVALRNRSDRHRTRSVTIAIVR